MMDYVRREDAIKSICYACCCEQECDRTGERNCSDYLRIKNLPAADVRETVSGEWIYKQIDNFRKYKCECPFCHAEYVDNYDGYVDVDSFNYCPNCGVDMRGENHDDTRTM